MSGAVGLTLGQCMTGGITLKDRASLDRLRAKLGLSPEGAQALETELSTGG